MRQFLKASLILSTLLISQKGIYSETNTQNTSKPECYRELILSYFPEPFVKEVLKKNQVPEEKWNSIIQELASQDKNVISKVEMRAHSINPQLLKSPEYREQAITLFREILLEIFSETMQKNGVNDEEKIQTMLDEVQRLKAKKFVQCLERTQKESDLDNYRQK